MGVIRIFYVIYSTLLHLRPLRFQCVGVMLGLNPGLLRIRHWQLDAVILSFLFPKGYKFEEECPGTAWIRFRKP
jgi:hypothetical protein